MKLFNRNNRNQDERNLHPFSNEGWDQIEIDTHPGEPFDTSDFPLAGSGEHEGQFYCGICGWVPIEEYHKHRH